MKTTNEIKKWLKTKLGLTVKGHTSSGRGQWQSFHVPSDKSENHMAPLKYSLPMFPPEFTNMCIKIVYPATPSLHTQTTVNNIDGRHVDMRAPQWEQAIAQWEAAHP